MCSEYYRCEMINIFPPSCIAPQSNHRMMPAEFINVYECCAYCIHKLERQGSKLHMVKKEEGKKNSS